MGARVVALLLFLAALACGQDPKPKRAELKAPAAKKEPAPEPAKDVKPRPIPADWPPKHERDKYDARRARMVTTQIQRRRVKDPPVLRAMRTVPRHRFMPKAKVAEAYEDRPVRIGHGQTISQPYIVASMTEELQLKKGMKVLEIGTGSGYQAAVLAEITPWVYSIEIKRPLAQRSKDVFKELGYTTIKSRHGDGYYGWKEAGPFDAIIVTAAAPHIPPPLVKQLKPGGRMILPVGPRTATQDLILLTKDMKGKTRTRSLYPVRFVPLTGSLGSSD